MNYSITQERAPLRESLYTIDKENKVFISTEDNLVLDFSGLGGWTFKAGFNCTFSLDEIDTCTFKNFEAFGVILDNNDNKAYILNKDLEQLFKVKSI